MNYPIIIPLHPKGGKFLNNSELRFALRSLEKHFKDAFEIVIVSAKLPTWLTGVKHLKGGGLKSSLKVAAEHYPAGFFWFYDDLCLLRDTTAETMKITPACKGWGKGKTGWSRALLRIRARLVKEGRPTWDYSRPHGPYWFDKTMVDEGFADWPGMASKFPWESWILSKRDWPRRHGVVKQYYGPFRNCPGEHSHFVNYNDKGNSVELRDHLAGRFPEASRFEIREPVLEVHTLRFGTAWWVTECAPTLDAWCARHGHALRVWGNDVNPEYPSAKFCEIDMLREFLQGKADQILYVDADVYVHPDAVARPPMEPGFHIRSDRPSKFSRHFPRWCSWIFGRRLEGWTYRNAGIWTCDRAAAEKMLEVIAPPYHACVQEQHQFNWWMGLAAANGMPVHELPAAWNAWPAEDNPANFFHLCGQKKAAKFRRLKDTGLIQKPAMPQFREAFDFSKYRFALCGTGMPMDEFHIHLLHRAACIDTGTAPSERVAVEVGSYRGASTAALIEALNRGAIGHLHIVEPKPTDCLKRVLSMADHPEKVTLHKIPFWDTLIGPCDFVFIDGDHKWPAVGDALRALSCGAKIICMHDSRSYPRIEGTWGAKIAADCLRTMPGRVTFEDDEDRPGTSTFRGFFVSAIEGIDLSGIASNQVARHCRKSLSTHPD